MWIFEATYENMNYNSFVKRKIEFDGDNFFDTEYECYEYAMREALNMKQKNECLSCLEFITR